MPHPLPPAAIAAIDVPLRTRASNYPPPFARLMIGREKRQLGEWFGLTNFGVNLTRLAPGAMSALHHRHSRQDELIYVLEGHPTLFTDNGPVELAPGMVAGFPAGGTAHHLENRSAEPCLFIEIGDRTAGDQGSYPDDDLQAVRDERGWRFTHKDGSPYDADIEPGS